MAGAEGVATGVVGTSDVGRKRGGFKADDGKGGRKRAVEVKNISRIVEPIGAIGSKDGDPNDPKAEIQYVQNWAARAILQNEFP